MKTHTDFNDLATRSVLGRDGVERQALAALGEAKKLREQVQKQEHIQKPVAARGLRAR